MFSSPECPIHDQTGHQNRRHTSTTTPLQRPKFSSPETADSYLRPWGVSRPARDETEATASGIEWVDRTDFLTARPKPSRTGGADTNASLELQENGMRKGGREPLCFYGGAFPLSSTAKLSPKEERKEPSGDFLPKLYLRDDGKSEVSVCSFDSDLLDEGVEEGKEEKRVGLKLVVVL